MLVAEDLHLMLSVDTNTRSRACEEALEWLAELDPSTSAERVWAVCPRADWMIWLMAERRYREGVNAQPVFDMLVDILTPLVPVWEADIAELLPEYAGLLSEVIAAAPTVAQEDNHLWPQPQYSRLSKLDADLWKIASVGGSLAYCISYTQAVREMSNIAYSLWAESPSPARMVYVVLESGTRYLLKRDELMQERCPTSDAWHEQMDRHADVVRRHIPFAMIESVLEEDWQETKEGE